MTGEVLFRMQMTRDGLLTVTRAPDRIPAGQTVEQVVASVLHTIADSLESGATRLSVGEVPE